MHSEGKSKASREILDASELASLQSQSMERAVSNSEYHWPPVAPQHTLAVLISGGLDSAILLGEAVKTYPTVQPIYVRVGSAWEPVEEVYLQRFLSELACEQLLPLKTFEQPVSDLYETHWSLTGEGVPALGTPDKDSFLPGRNVLLFAKPLLWCASKEITELATAPLASNPFPDATPEFYDGFAKMVNLSVGGKVRIIRPYMELGLHKADVIRRGAGLLLQHTLSCAKPINAMHCGDCAKCGERILGFKDAAVPDPTVYNRAAERFLQEHSQHAKQH